jgi:hypothetical protein
MGCEAGLLTELAARPNEGFACGEDDWQVVPTRDSSLSARPNLIRTGGSPDARSAALPTKVLTMRRADCHQRCDERRPPWPP